MTGIRKIPFREWQIRVRQQHNGNIQICLADLCSLLKRDELLNGNAIIAICPSSFKIPFREGGRAMWSIRPTEMRRLLQHVRKESILPRDFIDDLEVWGNKLLELELENSSHSIHTEDAVRNYAEDFPITFRHIGDRLMVNATQITMHFGGRIPSEWLRIAATDSLRRTLANEGRTGKYESQIFTTRGRGHGATWLEAPLIVPLAKWLTPDAAFAEWCQEQIQSLSYPEQLSLCPKPQQVNIRIPCMVKPIPDTVEAAAQMIAELRKVVKEFAPKIVFYEEFIENRDWFKSTRIADELGITAYQLHQFLSEEGICKYEKRQWSVFPSYRALQCDVPYTWENSKGKVYTFGSTKRWTQSGREYIIDLWRTRHSESPSEL